MTKRKKYEPYTLFTQEEHERIEWTYDKSVIERAQDYWAQEYSVESIAKMLKMDEFSVMLILLDLLYIGKIKRRRSGLLRGRVA